MCYEAFQNAFFAAWKIYHWNAYYSEQTYKVLYESLTPLITVQILLASEQKA